MAKCLSRARALIDLGCKGDLMPFRRGARAGQTDIRFVNGTNTFRMPRKPLHISEAWHAYREWYRTYTYTHHTHTHILTGTAPRRRSSWPSRHSTRRLRGGGTSRHRTHHIKFDITPHIAHDPRYAEWKNGSEASHTTYEAQVAEYNTKKNAFNQQFEIWKLSQKLQERGAAARALAVHAHTLRHTHTNTHINRRTQIHTHMCTYTHRHTAN